MGPKWFKKRKLIIILTFLFAVLPAYTQGSRGSITGRVTDQSDAQISHAKVVLIEEATHVQQIAESNDVGQFVFNALNPGRYSIVVSAHGFGMYRQEHMQVDVGGNVQADVKLSVGSASTEVIVTAEAQQLSFSSANLGMVVEEKSMTDLPLVYGNPFALMYLAPGITLSSVNPNIHVYDSVAAVSINGSALNSIDFKLDGAADNRIRTSAFIPNTESISQYRMSTATYDASQGHASGGFVNVQTKSGTNAIHGAIFSYYQNPKINANSWMLNPTTTQQKPTFMREGFALGGPLKRQKLFYFVGYEHSFQKNSQVDTLQVPTQKEIAGDFSDALALDTTAGSSVCSTARVYGQTETANAYQIFDARSAAYNGKNYARTCIPGNNLAAYTTIDPIAKNILSYYPKPNGGDVAIGNYSYSVSAPDTYNGEVLRFDYSLNQQQNIYAHLLKSERYQQKNMYFGRIGGTILDYQNYGVALGHTIALNASTALDTTLSYTRFVNQNTNAAQGTVTPTTIGMPSYLVSGLPAAAKALPSIGLSSYDTLNSSAATLGEDDIWLGSSTLSKQVSSHFLRVGIEYRRYITSGMSGSTENGSYSSSGTLATQYNGASVTKSGAVLAIAQLEQGMINSGSQTQNADFLTRSDYWALFLQDDWRVSKSMTVNAGLRWEHERPMRELNGKEIVSFNFNATNSTTSTAAAKYLNSTLASGKSSLLPSSITPTGGAIFANTKGYGPDAYKMQWKNFSPRIGFSYAINNTTVVRGGYGIFFDNLVMYYLSGGNGGSTTTYLVPQQGYSAVSNVTSPTYTGGSATSAGQINITSTLADPFSGSLTTVTGNSLGYDTALGQDLRFLQPSPKLTYNQRLSFGVQHQFGKFIVSIDYVGNMGRHIPVSQTSTGTNYGGRDYNPVAAKYYSTLTSSYDALENYNMSTITVPNPFYGLMPKNASNNLSSSTIGIAQLLRPRPEFGRINAFTTDGVSSYNAAQMQMQRRFTTGLSSTAAFTYSHALDGTVFLNPSDSKPWYGLSSNDRPLRFSASLIYQLPWGHGRQWLATSHSIVAQAIGGWQIQGVYQAQSGAPLSFSGNYVYYGKSPADSAWSRSHYKKTQVMGSSPVGGYWFNPANWLTSQSAVSGVHTVTCPTFNISDSSTYTCAKNFPGTYQLNKFSPRYGSLRADHLNQVDFGLQRQFKITKLGGGSMMQFRLQASNLLNHPVYSAPNTTPTNALFGQIETQANEAREYQFAVFIRF